MSLRVAAFLTACMILVPLGAQAESDLLRAPSDYGRDLSRGDRGYNDRDWSRNHDRNHNNRNDWANRRDRWDDRRDRDASDRLQDRADRLNDRLNDRPDRIQARVDAEQRRRAAQLDYRNYMVNFNGPDGAAQIGTPNPNPPRVAPPASSNYWNARNERRNRFR